MNDSSADRFEHPPAADEIEISVFGVGVGECIVAHLGAGEWAVLDSCLDPETKSPVALAYLAKLGVDVAEAVKLVVVTHWHDDHMKGADAVYRAASNARFACSAALKDREFFTAIAAARQPLMDHAGLDEMSGVFSTLSGRRPGGRAQAAAPIWALSGRPLYARHSTLGCVVTARSPSDGTMLLAQHELAELLPSKGSAKRRAVARTPNQLSVVLSLQVGGVHALLGSDLETSADPQLGWSAILTSPPTAPAHIFKVPHHGSTNADHPAVWEQLLIDSPHAVVTSFATGKKPLPSEEDLFRLRSRTPQLYWTGRGTAVVPKPRSPAVERTVDGIARNRRVLGSRLGHVQMRAPALVTPDWPGVVVAPGAARYRVP